MSTQVKINRKNGSSFNYKEAFSRNLGWITEIEQAQISQYRIAIAGMGGVGGSHLIGLIRMGFTQFTIADPDTFELANFNRQYGATLPHLQKNKAEVMKEMALMINPQADIKILPGGISEENLGEFLSKVDLYVDGLDLFELKIRQKVFRRARTLGIPSLTSAPIGFGATSLVFSKESMSFDEYFDFKLENDFENLLKFVVGLAPSLMHVKYLADRRYSNLAAGKTSSTPAGCFAATAIVCSETVKILLGRGRVRTAPTVLHYDFFLGKVRKTKPWLGLRGPLMKLKVAILKFMLSRLSTQN